MRKRTKTIAVLLTSIALCVSTITGCGSAIDGTKTAATCNGENVSLGLASLLARYQQANYTNYYSYFGSAPQWTEDAGDSTGTLADSVKSSVMDSIEEMYLLKEHAGEYDVSITDDDKKKIGEAADQFIKDNTDDALKKIGCSRDDVYTYLELLTIQSRMTEALGKDVDTNVPDEDANQSSITYVSVSTSTGTTETSSGEAIQLTDEEKTEKKKQAQQVLDKVKAAGKAADADMDALAKEVDENLAATDSSFGKDDTTLDDKLKEEVKKKKDGELVDHVIEGADAYYVARMDKVLDEDATKEKKDSIIEERKTEAYNKIVDPWKEAAKFTVDDKVWAKVELTDTDSFIFKSAETTAGETTGDSTEDSTADSTGDSTADSTGDTTAEDAG